MPTSDYSEQRKEEQRIEALRNRIRASNEANKTPAQPEKKELSSMEKVAKTAAELYAAKQTMGLGGAVTTHIFKDSHPEFSGMVGNIATDRHANKAQKKEADAAMKSADAAKKSASKLDDLRRGGSGAKDFNSGWLTFIIFLALIVHIYDTWTNYVRPPDAVVLAIYLFIVILTFFFVSHMKLTGENGSMFIVIVVCIFLPVLIHYIESAVTSNWILTITGLIIFFPPLVLYLFLQYPEHSAGAKIIKIYFVIWSIIAILYLITSPAAQQATQGGKTMIKYPLEAMKFVGEGILGVYTKTVAFTTSAFDKAVAQATGQQYEGDQENQRGIFLEGFAPVEKTYYTTSDIWIEGRIRAQNIKELIAIRTTCSVPDKNIRGDVTPLNFSMINNDENILDCHLGSLPAGTYQVKVSATFQFRTDAEIKYYFVDNKVKPATYSKAKIPDKTVAIYTGGPVEVGLASLHQPLRISSDPADESNIKGTYPFGVSLTNLWTSGRISQGKSFILEVPTAVNLINCTREMTQPCATIPGRNRYCFGVNQYNVRQAFDSVTCRMQIINPSELLGANLEYPPERTFNANVTYEYTVEAMTYVTVEKDYLANP